MSSLSTVQHEDQFQSFTCFPKLPLELRRVIWHLTKPERIITFKMVPQEGAEVRNNFLICQPRRPLSEVTREAREETRGDCIHVKQVNCPWPSNNNLFFNPHPDTILLPALALWHHKNLDFLMDFQRQYGRPIKKLAFNATDENDIAVLYRHNVLLCTFNHSWNENAYDSLEELCFIERRTGMPRSEHAFKPGAQILIGGKSKDCMARSEGTR
jgi:hypothetical protein